MLFDMQSTCTAKTAPKLHSSTFFLRWLESCVTDLENMMDINKINTVCVYFYVKKITPAIPSECSLSQCADINQYVQKYYLYFCLCY